MVLLYVKKGEEASRTEVTVERVEGMRVRELREIVARTMGLERGELNLMYGGCILKVGKTLDHYQITEGCTLHIVHRRKKVKYAPLPIGPEGMTVIFADSGVQREMAAFISDPGLLAKMVPFGNRVEIEETLKDPELLAKMSDMTRIRHHIHKNSTLFPVMQALLKLHRLRYQVRDSPPSMEPLSVQVGQIFQLVNGGGAGLGGVGGASEVEGQPDSAPSRLASAQEQMFEHSQALHSHQPAHHPPNSQMHGTIHAEGPSSGAAAAAPLSSFLTPADLASALANIVTEQPTSLQPDSLQPSGTASNESSQPSSLQLHVPNLDFTAASAPASLHLPEGPDSANHNRHTMQHPPSVNRSLSDSGATAPAPFSQVSLQQALNLALRNIPQQSSGQRPASSVSRAPQLATTTSASPQPSRPLHTGTTATSSRPPPLPPRVPATSTTTAASRSHPPLSQRQQELTVHYQAHLDQLHTMGITYSDAECLHALEAAQGDLQTALEILMGPGN